MSYKLTKGWPQRLADGAFINPESNVDYLAWLAAGNTPMPIDPPTVDEIKVALTVAVQEHLDTVAAGLGYDNIYTACTYAEEPAVLQFQVEGRALRAWRSLVWASCHAVMTAVLAGQRPVPTATELIAELPVLVMP